MRREHAVLAKLALCPWRLGERIEAVGVDDKRTFRPLGEVDDQSPGRAVAAETGTDDADFGGRELAQDRVIGGVAIRTRRRPRNPRAYPLGALVGQDGGYRPRHDQPPQPRAGAS